MLYYIQVPAKKKGNLIKIIIKKGNALNSATLSRGVRRDHIHNSALSGHKKLDSGRSKVKEEREDV